MKDRMLYIANIDLADNRSGITRKVLSQFKVFESEFDAFLVGYDGRNIKIVNKQNTTKITPGKKRPSTVLREVALKVATDNSIKYIYIRRMEITPSILLFLNKLKKNSLSIIWEIPTFPYDYEKKEFLNPIQKMRAVFRLKLDLVFRSYLRKYVDRIVTFSHVNNIFGIKTIVTGNGVDVSEIRPRRIANHSDEIHFIAVAVMRPWHAYDRFIKGIKDYYDQGGTRSIFFHVVGDGSILNDYKKLVEMNHLNDHVIFYGSKTKDEIDEIYDKADVAVESLGWHRSNVPMGTSIKTREYVAKGLPIIASSPMDIFPEGWEYAYYAPIDESNIKMDEVIEFYDQLFANNSKDSLASYIRTIAFKKCDMKIMMRPILEYYNTKKHVNSVNS